MIGPQVIKLMIEWRKWQIRLPDNWAWPHVYGREAGMSGSILDSKNIQIGYNEHMAASAHLQMGILPCIYL